MKLRAIACLMAAGLLASACGAKGAEEAAKDDKATQTTTQSSDTTGSDSAAKIGTLASPCGKGSAKVAAADAGTGTDKLYIGVGNDRDSIRPGLLKELWDGTNAFVKWCNDQGGINGLQLEAVDLDGKVLEVEAAMAKACTSVFAIVGGGWAQDNFIFSGKDGSDFHKCKMMAVPGFAVSADFAEATDQVQPVPNPAYQRPTAAFEAYAKLYPEQIKKFGVVFGNLPSIVQNKDQIIGVAKKTKGFDTFGEISYDIINQDWALIAQQVVDKGLKMVSFVGEPPNMSKFSQALKDLGYDGIINADANQYDTRLIEASGASAVEGDVVRIPIHMFEEASKWPAVDQMVKALDANVPGWQHAGLATYAFSAGLLFATAAKSCADEGDITRVCVLKAAKDIHKWDGGGLQAETDPGANAPGKCLMLVQIKSGKFERLFPKLGSKDDNGEGFFCGGETTLTGDFGKGNTDSSILGS
ncbi:MAG: ABC transporter substrate-binding protein [Acidimicrobiales bacterium]